MEEGSNTSTVGLQVAGGDEKRTQCLGVNWATVFLGYINMGIWPLESETEKMVMSPMGLRSRNDHASEGQQQL
jgi:hypothetical protein